MKYREPLLKIDTTWTKEHFDFPLSFAPTINFEGYEEAVFLKSWSDSNSIEFWSYAFAWEISRKEIFAEKEIETVLNSYFNGLMNIDSSRCNINSKIRISKQTIYYGSIATKDAFFSQKPFNLNVRIEQFFNKATGKMLVLYKLSPQDFEKEIWTKLEKIKIINTNYRMLR